MVKQILNTLMNADPRYRWIPAEWRAWLVTAWACCILGAGLWVLYQMEVEKYKRRKSK